MKPLQRKAINHRLNMAGLASLDDPRALLNQVALGITSHEKFRAVLLKCEPEQRQNCYEALKDRLPFEARSLESYIIEGKQEAEAQKLPVFDSSTGKLMNFEDYNPTAKPLERLAQEAIEAREREEAAKGSLEMVCRRCTRAETFPAKNRGMALKAAEIKGWRPDGDKALCPKCAKLLRN